MSEVDILQEVGGEGFLRSYIQFCADVTDAPRIFHLGVGLVILGAAMGNQVRIPSYGGLEIFPNLWVVLVAPSGFFRKSTTLYQGKNLLRHSLEKAILADDFTPEQLTAILQTSPAGLLVVSEFTRLLDLLNRDYNAGLRQMLTELYDSPETFVVERKKEGKRIIENAAISLAGATTLDWLAERVKSRDLRGGFLARFLFLPAIHRGPRIEGNPHVDLAMKERLRDWLRSIAELEGTANYKHVWGDYADWLYNYERRVERSDAPKDLAGIYSRTGTTVLKLALIFQASLRPQIEITSEAMQMAQTFITYIHETTRAVASRFADDWFGKQLQRVMTFLMECGGRCTRQDLTRSVRIESRKLDSVIKTLVEQGRIEVTQAKREGKGGRGVTYYTFIE